MFAQRLQLWINPPSLCADFALNQALRQKVGCLQFCPLMVHAQQKLLFAGSNNMRRQF
jgi:hypothetical protein